ncbi:MAG: T9SS type A sorting domain-containing protein [Flavobacterium sp.]
MNHHYKNGSAKFLRAILIMCLMTLSIGSVSAQTIRYVKPVASGTGDGSSWANASNNLQLMINNSATGNQVWVAAGTYVPGSLSSQPTNRNNSFSVKSNVKVYGSFAGTETSITARNIAANPTILSGDLLANDVIGSAASSLMNNSTMADNAYHVVVASSTDVNTIFDGFTITAGYANGTTTYSSMRQEDGAGLYVSSADGIYSNIVIKNCFAKTAGGGMYINNYSTYLTRFNGLAITNCVSGNSGSGYGAAIYAWGTGTKSEFYNLLVANCIGESAVTEGFQMYLRNATFYNISAGNPSQYNCVIDGSPYIYNSIIGQHSQTNAVDLDGSMWTSNCSIYGIVKTNSNTWYTTSDTTNNGNPGFVDAANGDFRLAAGSSCIATGDEQYLFSSQGTTKGYPQVNTDIAGSSRIQGTLDKGAYEFYQPPAIRYVKPVASGTGDGSSWANASSDLQLMINSSDKDDQVWVAKGTYKPNRQVGATAITANNRDNAFVLKSGVKVYGSFSGNESTIEGRQFETNATILSGDFSGNDPNNTTNAALLNNSSLTSENAHHVVVAINLSTYTIFDGFVITGGIANGSGSVSVNVTPTTTQNMLRTNGSGMYVISSSGQFNNIAIKASRASSGGGGIYIHNGSSLAVPRFSGLIITGCLSGSGSSNGSAIYSFGTGANQETKSEFFNMLITNCAGDNAVYVTSQYTQVYITNATFYGLFTTYTGPNSSAVITTNSAGYVTLTNSIIAQHAYAYSFNIGASSFVSTKSNYNSVYKPKWGDGTLLVSNATENSGDPGFVNAAAGNFNLQSGSGSINAGNDSYLVTTSGTTYGYPAISTDIAGNIRSRNTVDQGAYESNYNPNTIRYVKTVASGTGDGSSWANASNDLQLMINQSNAGNQVWVAKGTYKPNRQPNSTAVTANHRDNTFLLKSGVKVYGSFAGNESTIEGREFETNPTILSGDFSGNDPNNNNPVELLNETLTSDNAHHVVMGIKLSNATVFDGFVITGGAATTPSSNVVASTTQDVWRGNGGGIYLDASGGQYNNIAIRNCAAQLNGGGMYIQNTGTYLPRFTGLIITGCIASGTSTTYGSAIRYGGADTKAEFFNMLVTNCVGQSALRLSNQSTQITIGNATFYGIYSDNPNTTTSVIETTNSATLNLYNSIIGQHAQAYAISIIANSTSYGRYNSIFGNIRTSGTWNANNSTTNTGNPGFTNAAAGDFSLTATSPVRGLGNPSYLETYFGTNIGYPVVTTDIVGNSRVTNGVLDLGAYQYFPPCIVPAAPLADAQAFCGAATVANLTATGTDLKWYTASTGGTALVSSTAVASGTYYVSQSSGVCESARTAVSVTVNTIPAQPAGSDQTLCEGATVASLIASGTNLKWYANAVGGNALTVNELLETATYYVSQTNAGGCESQRAAVQVTVMALPPAPGAAGLQTFCGTPTVGDLETDAPETKWYATATGGSSIPHNTALTTGTYYGSQMNMTCESARVAVEVVVNPIPAQPTANAQTFCGVATVGNLAATGTNLKWYASANGGNELSSNTSLATGTYYVSQTINGCESALAEVQITVAPLPAAPVASAQTFCGMAIVGNLAATGTNLKWYASANGGDELSSNTSLITGIYFVSQNNTICESARTAVEVTVVPLPAAPVASAQTFCGMATVGNLAATGTNLKWYVSANGGNELSSNTSLETGTYYVSQTINGCESARTAVEVTVAPLPAAPVASAQTFCGVAIVGNLAATGTNLKWYESANGGDELSSNTSLVTGTYFVSQNNTVCESARTAVEVTVVSPPAAPVASAQTFCGVATVGNLAATGTNLKWYASANGGSALAPATAIATATYYVSASNGDCEGERTAVDVVVNPIPAAPTATAQEFCTGATVNALKAEGTNLKWYESASNATALAGGAALNTGTYYVSQTINGCEGPRTNVSVTIFALPSAPTATAQSFCGSAMVSNLSATGENLRWYSVSSGGTVLSASANLVTGTYYVTQTSSDGCESSRTAVQVVINPIPTAPHIGGQVFCSGATVASLATDGTDVKWYASASGNDVLAADVLLATGVYYATQTLEGCESERTAVSVIVNTTLPAPQAENQVQCSINTVADLVATGENLKWYTSETGGEPLAASVVLTAGNYYVSQTGGDCESTRTAVVVTIVNNCIAIESKFCGVTTIFGKPVYAEYVAGATAYRFMAKHGNEIQVIEKAQRYFTIAELQGYNYNMTYLISVSYFKNGEWSAYGPSCPVSTPALETSKLRAEYCGMTVESFSKAIYAQGIQFAAGYRFRINDNGNIQIIEKTAGYFFVNEINGYTYNKIYVIEVSVKVNGQWGAYGAPCNLSMPVAISKLDAAYCGLTVDSFTKTIYAQTVQQATGYRFRINDNGNVQFLEKTQAYFVVNEIVGYTYNKVYTIDVSVKIGGEWSAYGTPCTLSMPVAVSKLDTAYCGATTATVKTVVYAKHISVATRYRFRIFDGANTYILENSARYFGLYNIPGNGYDKTYTVDVALQIGGGWGPYGEACTVSTPNSPTGRPGANYAVSDYTDAFIDAVPAQQVSLTSYPNPYTESFTIEMNTQSLEKISIRAFDMNGRLVDDLTIAPDELASQKLGGRYAAGVYNVIVTQGDYQKVFKVVKR